MSNPEDGEEGTSPLADITLEQFRNGRNRRFGTANPEKFDIPFWNAMVKARDSAWATRAWFLNSEFEADCNDPIWCNKRFGKTTTELPDGTLVQIGGEHEDSYDPDFMVYNDVIVFQSPHDDGISRSSGNFEVFGYSEDAFPPTDFHTATYVPSVNAIVIIGNLSYSETDRELAERGITPVYVLHVGSWKMEKKETTGDGPGIIWRHEATLKDGVLRVRGTRKEKSAVQDEESDAPDEENDTLAAESDTLDEESGILDEEWDATMRGVFKDGESSRAKVDLGESWMLDVGTWVWTREVNPVSC